MRTPLTTPLLKFLMRKGYTHCFSKTEYDGFGYGVGIVLTPVKSTGPILKDIPAKLDAFFAIEDELIRLLNKRQNIWMELKPDMVKGKAGLLFYAYLISKSNEACINY
jgi:hypothetical protein